MGALKYHIFYKAFSLLSEDLAASMSDSSISTMSMGSLSLENPTKSNRIKLVHTFMGNLDEATVSRLDWITSALVQLSNCETGNFSRQQYVYDFVEMPAVSIAGGIVSEENVAAIQAVSWKIVC